MNTARVLACLFVMLCLAAPARSDGLYLSLEGGAGTVDDWEHTRTKWTPCGPDEIDARATFDANFVAFGSAGYRVGQWRLELEGGYRRNELASYAKDYVIPSRRRIAHDAPSGDLSEASLMANVIYDIPLFERISLALGAGAGGDYARLKLDSQWAPVDDGDLHFAYQGLAGVNYALSAATVLFATYRYMDVSDVSFDPTAHQHLEGDAFRKQAASAGVRFALFVPDATAPPSPIPVPAPVTEGKPLEREFMVFFGFNQASLSEEALATIKQVVGAVRQSGSAAVRVVGHADRAGSIAYNKALSLRRAKSVRKALIAEGIASGSISISGRGESEPMVPTADGVREAQNRRVHISF